MLQMQEFVYSVVRRWRILVVVFVLAGVLGAGYYTAGHKQPTVSAPQSDATETPEETDPMVRKDWEQAEDFYVLKLSYVCNGSEDVESTGVLDAYKARLSGTAFKEYLKENYFTDEEDLIFISQIISVESEGHCLIFKCLYYDEEALTVISEMVDSYINSLKADMKKGLGDHSISRVDESVYKSYDDVTEKWLEKIKSYIKTEQKVIASVHFSRKDLVFTSVLMAFIGLFIAAVVIVILDSIMDRVYNLKQLRREDAELLGDYSYARLRRWIDKKVYRMFIKRNNFDAEGMSKLVAYKLDKEKTYVLSGKASQKALEKVAESLAGEGIKISYKPLPNNAAEDITALNREENVIFAARRFKENRRDVCEWLDTYADLGMKVEGVLFI